MADFKMLSKACKDLAANLNSHWCLVTNRTWVLCWICIGTNIYNMHICVCIKAFVNLQWFSILNKKQAKACSLREESWPEYEVIWCQTSGFGQLSLRRKDRRKLGFYLPFPTEGAQGWLRDKQDPSHCSLPGSWSWPESAAICLQNPTANPSLSQVFAVNIELQPEILLDTEALKNLPRQGKFQVPLHVLFKFCRMA